MTVHTLGQEFRPRWKLLAKGLVKMKSFGLVKSLAVAAVCAGVLSPAGIVSAGEMAPAVRPAAPVSDITLVGGQLNGRVVDAQGVSLNGAQVVIKQNGQEVARTNSDKNGQFSVNGLKGGVYQVSAGNSEGTYRVWTERTAPPSSKNGIVMVSSPSIVRAQFGSMFNPVNTTAIILGTTGTVLGAVALNEANNNDNSAPKTP